MEKPEKPIARNAAKEDRSQKWGFTAYEGQWPLFDVMPDLVRVCEWQTEECPETKRLHRQGFFTTTRQVRFEQAKKLYPGIHLLIPDNWTAWVQYCRKERTRVGPTVRQENTSKAMTMADALTRLASYTLPYGFDKPYDPESEYWRAVNDILSIDPNTVGLYTQPQYLRAWNHTAEIWKTNSAESVAAEIDMEQTDRQTDRCLIDAFVPKRLPKKVNREYNASLEALCHEGSGTPSPRPGSPSSATGPS